MARRWKRSLYVCISLASLASVTVQYLSHQRHPAPAQHERVELQDPLNLQEEKGPSLHHPSKGKLEMLHLDTSNPQPLPSSSHVPPRGTHADPQTKKEPDLDQADSTDKAEEEIPSVLKDFGLYLRMYSGKRYEYFNMLLPSMKYFWFLPVNLTVVLDDTPEDREFGEEIQGQFPYPKICHEKSFDPKYYNNRGHALQQLSNFYAELCFDKKYVGFIDTDTFFVTPVTPELLFNGTKPHVIGGYIDTWVDWRKTTKFALGKKEVFWCMSHFPVTMELEHIIEMREYMANLHNMSFLEVFQNFSHLPGGFSQYNIMCNYNWYFHRDKYQFHAQNSHTGKKWHENPTWYSMKYYTTNVTKSMKTPQIRSAVHCRHHIQNSSIPYLIRPGICRSGGFHLCPKECESEKETQQHRNLFIFEDSNWLWDERCRQLQEQHYRNVLENYSGMIKRSIANGCEYLAGKAQENKTSGWDIICTDVDAEEKAEEIETHGKKKETEQF